MITPDTMSDKTVLDTLGTTPNGEESTRKITSYDSTEVAKKLPATLPMEGPMKALRVKRSTGLTGNVHALQCVPTRGKTLVALAQTAVDIHRLLPPTHHQ